MVKNSVYKGKQLTVEDIKKAPREKHIPSYNYCGPATAYTARTSGKYEKLMKEAGKSLVGTAPYGRPKNTLDRACKAHDKVFGLKNAPATVVRRADRMLIKKAYDISKDSSKPKRERAEASAVVAGIGGKVALEKLGVIRKGAFSKGGDKEAKIKTKVKAGAEKVVKKIAGAFKRKPTPLMVSAGGAPPPLQK